MKRNKPKSKHYQMTWNIFHAVDVVEKYEAATGDKSGFLPYAYLAQIYKGNLMPALQLGTIANNQIYGVTFFAKIKKENGEEGIVERGFKIDTPMKLSEFISWSVKPRGLARGYKRAI